MYGTLKKIFYFFLGLFTSKTGVPVAINGCRIKLPAKYFRFYPRNYEQENFAFFRKIAKPGMTCIDIGAHFGIFSVFMQKTTGGKTYSFEPTMQTFEIFKKVIQLNNCQENIMPNRAAVSQTAGNTLFYIYNADGGVGNSLVREEQYNLGEPQDVQTVSVDQFVSEKTIKPGFIKIDAEGAELKVLRGASETIRLHRPHIILAMHPHMIKKSGDKPEEIWNFITEFYKVSLNNAPITKDKFCQAEKLFDVHLTP